MANATESTLTPVAPVEAPVNGWQLVYAGGLHDPVDGGQLEARSPIDGSLIGTIPNANAEDVDRAVRSATEAADDWAKTTPRERVAALEALSERIVAASERLAWLDTIDAGMPIASTRAELRGSASYLATWAYLAAEIKGNTFADAHGLWGFTRREPYGVVASILAFNHPGMFFLSAIGPALAAGNSIIIKPSEWTSLSALAIGEIAQEVLPPGLLNVVTGDGVSAGHAISEHPGIPRISFTGSIRSGRAVLNAAAASIKHVTLELGGKNPLVILPDAEVEMAVKMAVAGMNLRGVGGQSCQSCSRVLIHDSLYEEFIGQLIKEVESIRLGDPREEATEMGCMAYREHFERVVGYIELGVSEGAQLMTGGHTPAGLGQGCFLEPTVFVHVNRSMRIANEEIFGPVISVMTWSDRAEMLDIANSVEYGLTARIACGSLGEGLDLATKLQAGKIWVNAANGGPDRMPFGGYKHSGLGKQGDFESLVGFTQEKAVTVRY